MRIVYRCETGEQIVDLEIGDQDAPVKDLLAALGIEGSATLDGHPLRPSCLLSEVALCEGSLLETGSPPEARDLTSTILVVVGGIWAGEVHCLGLDELMLVGRDPQSDLRLFDPTVSRRHCSISMKEITDHGSRNGTTVDGHIVLPHARSVLPASGVVRIGATRIMLRASVDDRPLAVTSALGASAGTIPFNRPPRCLPDVALPELSAPAEAPDLVKNESLSVAGIVLPVVAGLLIALVLSPLFAIFAALGPVVAIGTWWEKRRRNRRDHRLALAELDRQVSALAVELPLARVAEIDRRRILHPDPAEVVRRAEGPSVHCWERRSSHPDAFKVAIGVADEAFAPTLVAPEGEQLAARASDLLVGLPLLSDVPVEVDLSPNQIVGLVGDRSAILTVARSLVLQSVVHHGPADLALVVGADDPQVWDWCRWLPHTADHLTARRGAAVVATADVGAVDGLLTSPQERAILAVIDGIDPFQGRLTVGRRLLASERSAAIVLVEDAHRLPAGCDLVVKADCLGRLELVDPRRQKTPRDALAWGVQRDVAERAARRLARLDDPELPLLGAGVPVASGLLKLLDISGDCAAEIKQRWHQTKGSADIFTPIGADAHGPLQLDLIADGPHVLIGGTTGSGKSELLRSLIAGVAASADPDHVAMVLIDYKGGAAFDCCADLPHVAGLVTDLDKDLGSRALRCLEAELRYREQRLREAGAEDLAAFRQICAARSDARVEPLPRLLVVVDEFATLAADLPDFLAALVGIAQRGRSLGVHLVLATQRPSGVVTDDIRANASCRIALRVTDPRESVDIIDVGDAAAIARSRPGRAIARFGPGEITAFQSALVTGHSCATAKVFVRDRDLGTNGEGPTDLQRLVASIRAAHGSGRLPRSPWPPALPTEIFRSELTKLSTFAGFATVSGMTGVSGGAGAPVAVTASADASGGPSVLAAPGAVAAPSPVVPVAASEDVAIAPGGAGVSTAPDNDVPVPGWLLVDEPDLQRQSLSSWTLANGHLVVVGAPGAGATTTLASAVLAVTRVGGQAAPHVHIIDFDAGKLNPLANLAHCGTLVSATDKELRVRLLRWLDEEIVRRRCDGHQKPPILLVIDDLAGLGRVHDVVREQAIHETLERIWADGPSVGITVAVSVRRAADLPPALAATAGTVLLHRVSDSADALRFGIKTSTETFVNGRVLRVGDNAVAQVIKDAPTLDEAVQDRQDCALRTLPHKVKVLAKVITQAEVAVRGNVGSIDTELAIAVGDRELSLVSFVLHRGEHGLILGPARSGRTNTLLAIALACGERCVIVGDGSVDDNELVLRSGCEFVTVDALEQVASTGPLLVLVDDCLSVADSSSQLARLVAAPPAGVHIVAAAKPDQLRSAYGHWAVDIRSSRVGILLRPEPIDGDLLGISLPARLALPNVAGRGVLVADSESEVVQVVHAI